MLYINIALLGISAITAIIKPDYIPKMAKYKSRLGNLCIYFSFINGI